MKKSKYPIFSFSQGRAATATHSGNLSMNMQAAIEQSNTITQCFHHDIRETVKEIYAQTTN